MNKRQKKKLEKKKALWGVAITSIKSQWNTNTPVWKRRKKSGRKRIVRYHLITMNHTRNFRRYDPRLFEEAMKRVNFDDVSHPIDSMLKELPHTFEIATDNISRR